MEPLHILRYLDHLTYVESLVYMVDEENETTNSFERTLYYDFKTIDVLNDDEFNFNINKNQAFSMLYRYLKQHNFYDNYTHQQLYNGLLYYKMEQYFSNELKEPNNAEKILTKSLIDKCNSLRSFDLRLMNLVTYKVTQQPYDEDLIKLLFIIEQNFEILEDLRSYEKDVLKNTFNIYRMYVNLYGKDCVPNFEKYCTDLGEHLAETLNYLRINNSKSSETYNKMNTQDFMWNKIASTQSDGSSKWNFPKPILNEHEWRKSKLSNS